METFISAGMDLEDDEAKRIINEACDQHSAVCSVRGGIQ